MRLPSLEVLAIEDSSWSPHPAMAVDVIGCRQSTSAVDNSIGSQPRHRQSAVGSVDIGVEEGEKDPHFSLETKGAVLG